MLTCHIASPGLLQAALRRMPKRIYIPLPEAEARRKLVRMAYSCWPVFTGACAFGGLCLLVPVSAGASVCRCFCLVRPATLLFLPCFMCQIVDSMKDLAVLTDEDLEQIVGKSDG